MKDTFRIGELAGKIGVQPESIRHYERIGLLPKTKRGRGGYRLKLSETKSQRRSRPASTVEIKRMLTVLVQKLNAEKLS